MFVSLTPIPLHSTYGSYVKGVFRANRCPLNASFNTHFTHSTRKVSAGILNAVYDSLDPEHKAVMDFQAYAAICNKTSLDQWEDYDRHTLIHIKAEDTKARNEHVCIIPRQLADWIRNYARQRADNGYPNTNVPFPNHETLWKDITRTALSKFGIRLTSHYLRKRFHTIAAKTAMPVNSWDYLMGDKQSWGHEAGTYTLEDFTELVNEYDRFLVNYLPIASPMEPTEGSGNAEIVVERLEKENQELKNQITRLAHLLSEKLGSE